MALREFYQSFSCDYSRHSIHAVFPIVRRSYVGSMPDRTLKRPVPFSQIFPRSPSSPTSLADHFVETKSGKPLQARGISWDRLSLRPKGRRDRIRLNDLKKYDMISS